MKKLFLIMIVLLAFSVTGQEKAERNFAVYQILIEPQENQNLAAWQIEIKYKDLEIVGIEGGDKPFDQPADYDAAGLKGGRIILAAFTLDSKLRSGEQLVARLHVLEKPGAALKSEIKVMAVANAKAERIQAKVKILKEETK